MTAPTPPIEGQAARLTGAPVDDPDETTLVCVVHLNARPVYGEVCAVTRAGAMHVIGRTPEDGRRIDSVWARYFADGTVRLFMSWWPGDQSGTAARIGWVDFPGALGDLGHEIRNTLYDRIRRVDSGASVILAERQVAALAPLREDIAALREQIEAMG